MYIVMLFFSLIVVTKVNCIIIAEGLFVLCFINALYFLKVCQLIDKYYKCIITIIMRL